MSAADRRWKFAFRGIFPQGTSALKQGKIGSESYNSATTGNLPAAATVPGQPLNARRVNHCLHRYAKRKSHSSKLFCRSGPTYTPYHMMVESRPPNLLLCLIGAPLRLQRRYHADPLLKYAAIVVYIGMPSANYTVASSFADPDQPTHHTILCLQLIVCRYLMIVQVSKLTYLFN